MDLTQEACWKSFHRMLPWNHQIDSSSNGAAAVTIVNLSTWCNSGAGHTMIPVQQHLRSPGESLAFSGGCNWSIVGKCVDGLNEIKEKTSL